MEAVADRHGESSPADRRVTSGNTSRRKGGGAVSGALPIPMRRGQIRREERRRRQLRSLNVTRDSPRRGSLSDADRNDPGWSLSGTDRQQTVRNCVADTKRLVCDSLR